jgi:hypothetical protein
MNTRLSLLSPIPAPLARFPDADALTGLRANGNSSADKCKRDAFM